MSFNWTKVELKHSGWCFFVYIIITFNWTKVELKQLKNKRLKQIDDAFNWTKVELKPFTSVFSSMILYLLIELR